MNRAQKDWLDEITEAVYEVGVEGHTVFLRQPDLASVLSIQDHTLLTPIEREKYNGGIHGWSTIFYCMCIHATVKTGGKTGLKARRMEHWGPLIVASQGPSGDIGELLRKALHLCGYAVRDAEGNIIEQDPSAVDEVDQALEGTGDVPTT